MAGYRSPREEKTMRILMVATWALAASVGVALAQTNPLPPPSPSAAPPIVPAAPAATPPVVPPVAATPAKPKSAAEVAREAKAAAEHTIAECMQLWDKGTHMSKQAWASTCKRIQTRLENLKVENLDVMGTGVRKKSGAGGPQGKINSSSRVN
jgi:hypothetical protein